MPRTPSPQRGVPAVPHQRKGPKEDPRPWYVSRTRGLLLLALAGLGGGVIDRLIVSMRSPEGKNQRPPITAPKDNAANKGVDAGRGDGPPKVIFVPAPDGATPPLFGEDLLARADELRRKIAEDIIARYQITDKSDRGDIRKAVARGCTRVQSIDGEKIVLENPNPPPVEEQEEEKDKKNGGEGGVDGGENEVDEGEERNACPIYFNTTPPGFEPPEPRPVAPEYRAVETSVALGQYEAALEQLNLDPVLASIPEDGPEAQFIPLISQLQDAQRQLLSAKPEERPYYACRVHALMNALILAAEKFEKLEKTSGIKAPEPLDHFLGDGLDLMSQIAAAYFSGNPEMDNEEILMQCAPQFLR